MSNSEPVVLVLTHEEAEALLASIESAERGREDYEYLVSLEGGDYEPEDIARTRAIHEQEKAVEARVSRAIQAQKGIPDTARPRVYLDLITSTLPQAEMQDITAAPPTVRDHEYGAWVHVHPADADWDEDLLNPATNEDWEQFPVLNKVLLAARELGANWVNFDADGHDTLAGFPTFDW